MSWQTYCRSLEYIKRRFVTLNELIAPDTIWTRSFYIILKFWSFPIYVVQLWRTVQDYLVSHIICTEGGQIVQKIDVYAYWLCRASEIELAPIFLSISSTV